MASSLFCGEHQIIMPYTGNKSYLLHGLMKRIGFLTNDIQNLCFASLNDT